MAHPGLPFIQCRVPEAKRRAVEAAAAAEGVNRGELVRRAVDEYLTNHGHPAEVSTVDPDQLSLTG